MKLSLRRWKPGQLLLGWGAYWVGLIGVTLGPALRASWRATRLPDGHGSIAANYGNGTLSYTVIEEGVKTFTGSVSFSTALLLLIGPPLVLWLVWLVVRDRPGAQRPAVNARVAGDALPAGTGPAAESAVARGERVPADHDRMR